MSGGVIGAIIGLVINIFMGKKARKAAEKLSEQDIAELKKHFTVRQPKTRLVAGVFSATLFCGVPLIFLLIGINDIIGIFRSGESVWEALKVPLLLCAVFSPLFLLALWGLLRAVVWKVEVNGNWFVYTSPFGKKTEFYVKDITKIWPFAAETGQGITVYVKGKRMFSADPACENFFILASCLLESDSGA